MTMQEQRENVIKIFTQALDRCITASEEQHHAEPIAFEAQIEFRFQGMPNFCVKAHPALDFTRPLEPQFEPGRAKVVPPV